MAGRCSVDVNVIFLVIAELVADNYLAVCAESVVVTIDLDAVFGISPNVGVLYAKARGIAKLDAAARVLFKFREGNKHIGCIESIKTALAVSHAHNALQLCTAGFIASARTY